MQAQASKKCKRWCTWMPAWELRKKLKSAGCTTLLSTTRPAGKYSLRAWLA